MISGLNPIKATKPRNPARAGLATNNYSDDNNRVNIAMSDEQRIEYFGAQDVIDPENEDITLISSLPGNNEGFLYIAEQKGRYFWSISYCGEMDWQEISRDLYSEIKKHQEPKG